MHPAEELQPNTQLHDDADSYLETISLRWKQLTEPPKRHAAIVRLLYPDIRRALDAGRTRREIHNTLQTAGCPGKYAGFIQSLQRIQAKTIELIRTIGEEKKYLAAEWQIPSTGLPSVREDLPVEERRLRAERSMQAERNRMEAHRKAVSEKKFRFDPKDID
jgi:hypothetical protein